MEVDLEKGGFAQDAFRWVMSLDPESVLKACILPEPITHKESQSIVLLLNSGKVRPQYAQLMQPRRCKLLQFRGVSQQPNGRRIGTIRY